VDYQTYLEWLYEFAKTTECAVHAYVLMTNHVHLLVTPKKKESIGLLMKRLGQRYVQYINRTYKRSGTLWEGRFRSCIAQEDSYLLICQRYIELNPVRANMVNQPEDYKWSSYRHYAEGEVSEQLTPHFMYQSLGVTDEIRQKNYRELFKGGLEPRLVNKIREATNGNFVLGDSRFAEEISDVLKRRVVRGKAGRPAKLI
jgi:putative transposase